MQAILSYLDQEIAGREPSFTDNEIQAIAVEIIPLVEELNGRRFKTTPKVAITGNFEMIQILYTDVDLKKRTVDAFLRAAISIQK